MLTTEDLGDWRRTHYSSQITPEMAGKEVTVFGWIASIRDQPRFAFLILKDKEGRVQATIAKESATPSLLKAIQGLTEHASLGIRGVVKAMPKAPGGAEIIPSEIKVLARPSKLPPFKIYGSDVPSLDRRLDLRPVDLRREKTQAIFKLRKALLQKVREYFTEKGYFEIQTPKLIGSATEGGASLFSVLYYNQPAFLVQSPQLYKEEMVIPFEKVFEIGPVFRAEESRTQYHLSEVTSIDMEQAFITYKDAMETLAGMISYVLDGVDTPASAYKERLNTVRSGLPVKTLTYTEVVDKLEKNGTEVTWGDDLPSRLLSSLKELASSFYFITDWPSSSKPFYIKPSRTDPKISESFDLMFGPLELASGGTRVDSKKDLTKRLKEQKLKPQSFEYHLRAYDYGMPPHAGFAVGLERLTMVLSGEDNIREVTLFPRDKIRLAP